MVRAAQSSWCSAKLHFFDSYGPSSPEMNSADYGTRFMELYGIMNMSCNLRASNIEEIKQQVAEQPLTQHLKGAIFAFPCSPGRAETLVGWGWKTNHHSQQHLCQKLPKSVDVRWSYSVQHHCRFLRHSVYKLEKLSSIEDRGQTDRVTVLSSIDPWPWFSIPGDLCWRPIYMRKLRSKVRRLKR